MEATHDHLRDLTGLDLTAVPTQILVDDALEIALRHKITAYDACYVAAASQLRLPLITADKNLARQVEKGPHDVQWLGEVSLVSP